MGGRHVGRGGLWGGMEMCEREGGRVIGRVGRCHGGWEGDLTVRIVW